jgi:TrmH family RNA methyltransferase
MDGDQGQGGLELISSRRNPLVGRLRALHQGRGRREQQRLLLEGTHLLQEVLRLGLRPDWLLATATWMERHDGLLAQLRQGALQGARPSGGDSALQLRVVSEEVLAAVATTEQPDGVVLTLPLDQLPQPRAWPASTDQPGDSPKQGPPQAPFPSFVLALDRLQDPGNLGTLLRTALAAGIEEVWLAGGADPFQPKVLRASAGAALALPCRRHPDRDALVEGLTQAREAGLQLVATVVPDQAGHGEVLPYWELDWCRPTALLLGNEGAGLDPALQALASERVTIPHDRRVESLNVAVAAAPLLLERWRQRASPPPRRAVGGL